MELDIQGKKLFIDGSYYIFYRFFATYNWYRKQNESDDLNKNENITDDKIFMEKYAKNLIK